MRPATRASTACLLALSACGLERPARPQEAPAPTGLQPQVAFSEYSPLSSNAELVRRLLTPPRRGCVFNLDSETILGAAHEVATPAALSAALQALVAPVDTDPSKLAACRSDIERNLDSQLQKVESLTAGGRRAEAQKLLTEIHVRFGGLAAPRSLALQSALN